MKDIKNRKLAPRKISKNMSKQIIRLFTEDKAVSIVILLNAIVLFLLAFDQLQLIHVYLSAIDTVFLVYFLIEAGLKIRQSGWKKYIASDWNKFDFFIVLISLPSIILLFETKVTFLFVFRILRIFRFFKFLKFIPDIEELIAGIKRAFKASVFILLAFFIYMFLISMLSCRMFKISSPELFADPLVSFYSIFKVFTIEGWYEIPDTIVENQTGVVSFFVRLYFIIIVVSGGLFGLSIVNAIFVEEMVRDNNDELISKVELLEAKIDILIEQNKQETSHTSSSDPPST